MSKTAQIVAAAWLDRCPKSLLRPTLQTPDTNGRNSNLSAAHNQMFTSVKVGNDVVMLAPLKTSPTTTGRSLGLTNPKA